MIANSAEHTRCYDCTQTFGGFCDACKLKVAQEEIDNLKVRVEEMEEAVDALDEWRNDLWATIKDGGSIKEVLLR